MDFGPSPIVMRDGCSAPRQLGLTTRSLFSANNSAQISQDAGRTFGEFRRKLGRGASFSAGLRGTKKTATRYSIRYTARFRICELSVND
jgi:hypothetical protein